MFLLATKLKQVASSSPGGSVGKEFTLNAGDLGSIPGSGRSPGEGNGNHSSTLALRIPMTEELQCVGSKESA